MKWLTSTPSRVPRTSLLSDASERQDGLDAARSARAVASRGPGATPGAGRTALGTSVACVTVVALRPTTQDELVLPLGAQDEHRSQDGHNEVGCAHVGELHERCGVQPRIRVWQAELPLRRVVPCSHRHVGGPRARETGAPIGSHRQPRPVKRTPGLHSPLGNVRTPCPVQLLTQERGRAISATAPTPREVAIPEGLARRWVARLAARSAGVDAPDCFAIRRGPERAPPAHQPQAPRYLPWGLLRRLARNSGARPRHGPGTRPPLKNSVNALASNRHSYTHLDLGASGRRR